MLLPQPEYMLTYNYSGENNTATISDLDLSSPPKQYNPNLVPIGHGFGFIVFIEEVEDW